MRVYLNILRMFAQKACLLGPYKKYKRHLVNSYIRASNIVFLHKLKNIYPQILCVNIQCPHVDFDLDLSAKTNFQLPINILKY
jgi:hypothetical protein